MQAILEYKKEVQLYEASSRKAEEAGRIKALQAPDGHECSSKLSLLYQSLLCLQANSGETEKYTLFLPPY